LRLIVRWVIGFVVVAAGLVAPSSLAQVVLSRSVFRTVGLPSKTIKNAAVSCPRGYAAVSAGVSNPAPGVTVLSIWPSGLAGYKFRLGNPVTNSDQQVTVVVACRHFVFKIPTTRLKVQPVQMKLRVPAGQLRTTAFRCPPGTVPAGWGYDIASVKSGRGSAPGAAARVSLRRISMHPGGFSFSLRNSGSKAQSVSLSGTCLTVLRPAGTTRERLHVKIITFRVPLQTRSRRVVRRCPAGWVSLSAGYALRSPASTIDGAAAVGAGGRWWVASDSEGGATADLQLVCTRLSR
jgi:hypothetical protein